MKIQQVNISRTIAQKPVAAEARQIWGPGRGRKL